MTFRAAPLNSLTELAQSSEEVPAVLLKRVLLKRLPAQESSTRELKSWAYRDHFEYYPRCRTTSTYMLCLLIEDDDANDF